jgi:nucleoside-diphosphate-sugar epimerase
MLSGEKILVTGATGGVALPVIEYLAKANEVWGAARYGKPGSREAVEATGARAVQADIARGDLSDLPDDFTYMLQLAYFRGGADAFDEAMTVNAEGTGRIMQHCRKAKACLVMSANGVYAPNEDPWHMPKEDEPIGGSIVPWSPTSGTSKVAQEAVARFAARAFGLPTVITRLGTVYGPQSNRYLPVTNMEAIVNGQEVVARWDPLTHTPIHMSDICDQLEALLESAGTPANIVNWGGDEIVSVQDWCKLAGEFAGVEPKVTVKPAPGATRSAGCDPTKRRSITGPCKQVFAQAYREIYDIRYGAKA